MSLKMFLVSLVICGLLLSHADGVDPGECSEENTKSCTRPLEQYDMLEGSIVPSYSIEDTKKICRTYMGVKACIQRFERNCHPVDQRWLKGLHDSYKYLCEDHFEEYKRHRACLATPELHIEGETCNLTLHYSFNSRTYVSGSTQYKAQRICQYAKTYLSCVENLVQSFCDNEAASWQRGYDEASLKPILSYIGCRIGSDDLERTTIIVGVTVTIILAIVFVSIGVCICLYAKKKTARDARHGAASRPQPNGRAVYRVGDQPGAQSQVNVSPFAYSTPSPVPPPYMEKPPAYADQANAQAQANGDNPYPSAANDYSGEPTKMPLPPDYMPLDRGSMQGGAAAEGGAVGGAADPDYLVLQVPPSTCEEDGYEVLGSSSGGGLAQAHTDQPALLPQDNKQ